MPNTKLAVGALNALGRLDRHQIFRALRNPTFGVREFIAILVFSRSNVPASQLIEDVLADQDIEPSLIKELLETAYNSWTLQAIFEKLRSYERDNQGAPGIVGNFSKGEYAILHTLIRIIRPQIVVETGVAAGVSTTAILDALVLNGFGRLYSIDLPPELAVGKTIGDGLRYDRAFAGQRKSGWLVPERLRRSGSWELLLGDVRDVLPSLISRLERIDFFVHDDLHTPNHMLWEFNLVWPRLNAGGILASDDVNYGWTDFLLKLGVPKAKRWINNDFFSAIRKCDGPQILDR
jgi:hypothetical protein